MDNQQNGAPLGSLPLGFEMGLGANPDAMKAFCRMSEENQTKYIGKAKAVQSKNEMKSLISELSKTIE